MKETLSLGIALIVAASAAMAESTPKEEVLAAAKKLGEQANYAWKTTTVVPEDAQFHPGPVDGKTEKGGFTHVTLRFFENPIEIVWQGTNAAFTGQDGGWRSVAEAEADQGPGRFMALLIRNFQTPAEEAGELAGFAKELKRDGDAFAGDLTEEGAKAKLTFRRGGDAAVTGPKGSVKFWVKDGSLARYEFKVKGTVSWNGNDIDSDRTTTVEIKDAGSTHVIVPDEAKKKLSPTPTPPAK